MSMTDPTWEDCAEFMNQALGPLDEAARACGRGTPTRTPAEMDDAVELEAEVKRVQHEVAVLRARFDDVARQGVR